jgi:hypothetical protein
VERTLKTAVLHVTKHRSCLNPDLVETLVITKSNGGRVDMTGMEAEVEPQLSDSDFADSSEDEVDKESEEARDDGDDVDDAAARALQEALGRRGVTAGRKSVGPNRASQQQLLSGVPKRLQNLKRPDLPHLLSGAPHPLLEFPGPESHVGAGLGGQVQQAVARGRLLLIVALHLRVTVGLWSTG